jgi:hypothetical protein
MTGKECSQILPVGEGGTANKKDRIRRRCLYRVLALKLADFLDEGLRTGGRNRQQNEHQRQKDILV